VHLPVTRAAAVEPQRAGVVLQREVFDVREAALDCQHVAPGVAAVTRVAGSGTFVLPATKTLAFSGYDWEVRQAPSDRHGLNDYDARNAWVDGDGHLHLLLTQRDGHWTSADVWLTRSLGYGTYSFVLGDTGDPDRP
jgi:hypothetical protein